MGNFNSKLQTTNIDLERNVSKWHSRTELKIFNFDVKFDYNFKKT